MERDFTERKYYELGHQTEWIPFKQKVEISLGAWGESEEECLCETWHDENGEIHRDFGPAIVATSIETGTIVEQQWYNHGVRHREAGPAVTLTDSRTGEDTETWFYLNGVELPQQLHANFKLVP